MLVAWRGVRWKTRAIKPRSTYGLDVNSALRDGASLAQLLIDKGIISGAEYLKAIADGMEAEADGYRVKVARAAGCEKERIKLV